MHKKEGIKRASGASEKVFEVTTSRTSENTFLECRTNITFIINLQFEKKKCPYWNLFRLDGTVH